MTIAGISHRQLYGGLWCLVAVAVVWLNVVGVGDRFADERDLVHFDPDGQVTARAVYDRLGISTSAAAVFWVVSSLAFFAGYLVLGWLLVRRGQPAGFSAWVAVVMLAMTAAYYPPEIDTLYPGQPIQEWLTRLMTMVAISGFFILPLVFPTGRFVPRWTLFLGIALALELILFAGTGSGTPTGSPVVEAVLTILVAGTILGSAIYRYRRVSTPDQQRQTRWVVLGFLIGLPCFFVADAMMRNIDDSPRGVFFLIGFSILIQVGFNVPFLAVGMAILFHRLFDIDVILRRTLVWLAMTVAVVGFYIAVVLGLGRVLGSEGNLVLSLVATGVVAVAFQPVRARVQQDVNRLLFGDRDDPYAVIARLGHQFADAAGISDLLPQVVRTTADALRLPYVALFLLRGEGLELVASAGRLPAATLRMPLSYQGQPVGALDVAQRSPGEAFNAADRRLLEDLARQIGIAVHTVSLAGELQHSRERIVTSREEERRRLRRDLHDGLGAQLAALTMHAGAIRSLVRTDPQEADAELQVLRDELRLAIDDIRRLVQDLRPPALDELGLAGALRSRLEWIARVETSLDVRIEIDEPLPVMSAAVEVAAYRIVEEAVTNTIRHANASVLVVSLWHEGVGLVVKVADDGQGVAEARVPGVGTQSMRERATELGGHFSLEAGESGRGTIVEVTLPLEMHP